MVTKMVIRIIIVPSNRLMEISTPPYDYEHVYNNYVVAIKI